MHKSLKSMSAAEAGKRFLINLVDSLGQNHLAPTLVGDVIDEIIRRSGTPSLSWKSFLSHLTDIIFEDPDEFQFRGPETLNTAAEWITVKSLADVIHSLRYTSGVPEAELRALLALASLDGPHTQIRDDKARWIADMINDEVNGLEFAMARRFPNPKNGALRDAPSWYSRWSYFLPAPDTALPLAGQLRDWLGLGHLRVNHPLYLFRSRAPLHSRDLGGHRPTIFDGFDNKLYKHRCSAEFERSVSGSTMDIEKVRAARSTPPVDLEGGPEIVSRGFRFSTDRFVCEYVGKTPPLNLNLDCTYLHEHMLRDGQSLTEVIDNIVRFVDEARGASR